MPDIMTKPNSKEDEWVSSSVLVELSGYSQSYINNLARAGKFPDGVVKVSIGGHRKFKKRQAARFLNGTETYMKRRARR